MGDKGLRDAGTAGGDDNPVKRRLRGPPLSAIINAGDDIVIAEPVKDLACPADQGIKPLDQPPELDRLGSDHRPTLPRRPQRPVPVRQQRQARPLGERADGLLSRVAGRDGTWAAVPVPFVVRLPVAIAVVVWGAWTGRRWTVPVASMLALPALWYGGLSMLLAVIALREDVAPVRPPRSQVASTRVEARPM